MNELSELMGRSSAMESLRATIWRLVRTSSTSGRTPAVLIQGETGTGKGLIARLLHRLGPRRDRPFIDVNCAAIPDTLLESELFGFERGAFTDARRPKPGLFQSAHRGTIFLDEIALLPEALQAKLLKVIEEHSVRRLGATQSETVDVWVISATNADIAAAIRAGRFRADLYHRLAVLTLLLPPLRERGDDALLLAEHFLARAAADYGLDERTLAPDARTLISRYTWPGNVRQLANAMERATLLADNPLVTAGMLDLKEAPDAPRAEPAHAARTAPLDDAMRDHVQAALDQTGGNISRTAAALGITRNTLRAHIRKLGLRVGGTARPSPPVPDSAPDSRLHARAAEPVAAGATPSSLRWEHRMISILAVSLSVAPDTAVFQVASLLQDLIEKLRSFGARIEELTPVGVVAVFGLEPMENATSRAAHAALAMLKSVERAPFPVQGVQARLAIHSRRCLVAHSGDVAGMDPTDRREVFNTLDHLINGAPPNTIVVDQAAAQFLERRFELQPEGVVAGLSGAVYRVMGRERAGFDVGTRGVTPFVGRERELGVLGGLLARAEDGRGQIVGIKGEAGVGKSRLLHEFRRTLTRGDVTYLEGRCPSYGNTVAYLPFIDIIRSAFGLIDTDNSRAIAEKVGAGLATLALDPNGWQPYLLNLLGCLEGADRLLPLGPETLKVLTIEAIREVCLARSHLGPLVLAIEDLQWIDRNSEDVLMSVADHIAGSRILVLGTYRPGYQPAWLGRADASQLAVQGLTPADSRSVVYSVIPEQQLSTDLEQIVLTHAEGIPFFLEELARAIAEHPDLRSEIMVPDTIKDVLIARLDRLPAKERDLLQAASVIGKDVDGPILAAVTRLFEPALGRRLARLQEAEFLRERSALPMRQFTFKHALTHEVAYQSVPTDQRRALHSAVVQAIEATHPDRLAEHVDRLAYHAFRGEAWDKAVTYLSLAGSRALWSSANSEAAEFFGQVLTALRHLPSTRSTLECAIDIRLNLRDALWALAKLGEIEDHLREAGALAHTLGDRARAGWVACYLCQYLWSVGQLDAALEVGERALGIAESLPNPALHAEASFYVGLVHLALGEARRAARIMSTDLQSLDRVVEEHRAQFPSRRFAANGPILVRGWLARVLAELGEFREAEVAGLEAIRLAEAANSPFALTTALAGLGAMHVRKGQPEQAIPPLERGLGLSRAYKFNNWLPTVAACLGAAYSCAGRTAAGVALLEEAVGQGPRNGVISSHSLWLVYLAAAYLRAGRTSDALAVANRALTMCREHKERGYEAGALHLLGELAAQGDPPDLNRAESMYREALALATALELRPLAARCDLGLGRLYQRVGDSGNAQTHLARAAALSRDLDMPLPTVADPP